MKKYAVLVWLLLTMLSVAGCPAGGGGPTGPANVAPTLTDVTTSASAQGVHRGELLIFFIGFVDLSGDLNGGPAVVTDDEDNRYDNLFVSNAESTSGTLTITITVSNLLTPNKQHLFTIVVFDQAGNLSNSVSASVTVL
jgi:hypothetical protein